MADRLPLITSVQNARIKDTLKLLDRRSRNKTGQTRIDGGRELLRAFDGGFVPQLLFYCEEYLTTDEAHRAFDLCVEGEVSVQPVTPEVYDKLAYGDRQEGLCAVIEWKTKNLEGLRLSKSPLVLIAHGIEKPGNLGALYRTADAAGVDAMVVGDAVTDPANPNTIRASLGTVFTVPSAEASAQDAEAWLSGLGVRTYALRPDARGATYESYANTDMTQPIAIIVGSESTGLGKSWTGEAVRSMKIPMAGFADSLNVSASVAIVLFEAVRQRAKGN